MNKSRITIISLSILTTFTFFSCSSNKDMQPISEDNYESVDNTKEIIKSKKNTQQTEQKVSKFNTNEKKSISESLQDMLTMGNKNKFVRPDETTVFATSVTGSIKQQKSTIHISIKDELAGFGSPYMAAYYIVLMDENARKKLSIAYENYLYDFENKKLERKNRKSFKKYGNIDVTLNWGTISSSTPNNGTGSATLGYEFVKNSPYFTINCFPILNNYYDVVKESTSRESMRIKYYFTKAQLNELLTMIDEDRIQDALYETIDFYEEDEDIETDEYLDSSDE